MDESIAERAARIASRGVGSALAAERNAEFRIKAAEWHLHQLVEIGERLAVADRQRQNGRDDPVIETMNAMIDVPVRNALDAAARGRRALDLIAARYVPKGTS